MFATTDPRQDVLERTRRDAHPMCVVCGRSSDCGLGLRFRVLGDGSVSADFRCNCDHQGYEGVLHGGVISSLLDGAMTNCLFASGVTAVTAELKVRFRHPVDLDEPMSVRAWQTRSQSPLHVLSAEIVQAGQVRATAAGKFMERPQR
ncbi:MAG: PaaI family thioesterase [Phycisphaerae bacterium]